MTAIRDYLQLIDDDDRKRWVIRVIFAMAMSLYEAGCALIIYYLVANITTPGENLVFPVVGNLHQRFPGVPDSTLFAIVAVVVVLIFIARALLVVLQAFLINKLIYNTGVSLSRRLFGIYVAQPYSWHTQHNSSELIRNAYDSVLNVVTFFFIPITMTTVNIMMVVCLTLVLLIKAPLISLAAVGCLGLLATVILWTLRPRYVRLGEINQEAAQRAFRHLQQSLAGVRDVKVLGRVSFFQRAFSEARTDQSRSSYTRAALGEIPKPAIETTAVLLILVFLALSRSSGGTQGSTLADIGLFAYAVLRIMPALNQIVVYLGQIQFGKAAVKQVLTDLSLPVPRVGGSTVVLALKEELVVSNVSFRYEAQDQMVLSNVSFGIKHGESIGVVGPTGAGKTTLLDLLLGFLTPTSGSITVDGVEISSNVEGWQSTVGMVSQAHFLIDDTLRRNIALGVPDDEIDHEAVDDAVTLAQVTEFLDILPEGLDTVVGERGVRLSGGQRQRVTIARALYRRPEVLFLDEGTAALDNATEAEFTRALENLSGKLTVITVAHRLSTVRNCSRILFIQQGEIAGIGTYDELRKENQAFRLISDPSLERSI